MRVAADKGLTTPALMVNGFGHALLMITQGDRNLARKGSVSFKRLPVAFNQSKCSNPVA